MTENITTSTITRFIKCGLSFYFSVFGLFVAGQGYITLNS